MKFHKYVGAGNDFIIFNDLENKIKNSGELALKVCNRHFGLGADGMILAKTSSKADIRMVYYNSDGTEGEMCGNGIRCFSKYIYDNKIIKKKAISVETLGGIKYIEIKANLKNQAEEISVDMRYAIFEPKEIPVNLEGEKILEKIINIDGEEYIYSALNVGVPHVVIFVESINNIDINLLGRKIETHPIFPEKTNVNFVEILDENNINIYTWERGAGRTLGCGTGSCASVVVGNTLNQLSNPVCVKTEGGSLKIDLGDDGRIYMTGDAKYIARGVFNLE